MMSEAKNIDFILGHKHTENLRNLANFNLLT